ncbi:MAG: Ig domain-containing protein [Planctomycetota bacterium]|nr:Ig domain-containing protein [Planctomycetota bacterium]
MRALLIEFVAFLVVFAVGCNRGHDKKAPPPPGGCPGVPVNIQADIEGPEDPFEGDPYDLCIPVSGGVVPYAWSIISGTLPAGLTLDAAAGCITGTPAVCSAGTYPVTVQVTDSCTSPGPQTDTRQLSILITFLVPPPRFGWGDNFSNGISEWDTCSTFGGPVSSIDSSFGNPAPSLDVGGSSGDNGEAVTVLQTLDFDTGSGGYIAADFYIPSLGTNFVDAWIGLKNVGCDGGAPGLDSGAFIMFSAAASARSFGLNGTVVFSDAALTTGWHRVEIYIGRCRLVDYYVDGVLVYSSTTSLSTLYNLSSITVGGRSSGGPVRIDNVFLN